MENTKDNSVELIFIFSLMILSPGLSFIYTLSKAILSNEAKDYIYFSMAVGLNGYRWAPLGETFDIVRHQQTFEMLRDNDIKYFLMRLFQSESPLQIIFIKILSFWQDPKILNAILPFLGILILSYILYEPNVNVNNKVRIFYFSLVFSSFRMLQFTSGLWNYFAILIFSFSYLFLEGRPKFIVYLISVLLHFSMLYPLVIMGTSEILSKPLNENDGEKNFSFLVTCSILIILLAFFSPVLIQKSLMLLSYVFQEWNFINVLYSRFVAYFIHQDNHTYLMNYRYLLLELSKLFLVWFFLLLNMYYVSDENSRLPDKTKHFYFLLIFTSFTIGLGVRIRILLRFSIMPMLLISKDVKFLESTLILIKEKRRNILSFFLIVYFIIQMFYQIYSMKNAFLI